MGESTCHGEDIDLLTCLTVWHSSMNFDFLQVFVCYKVDIHVQTKRHKQQQLLLNASIEFQISYLQRENAFICLAIYIMKFALIFLERNWNQIGIFKCLAQFSFSFILILTYPIIISTLKAKE